jgi:hypothetical protein
VADFLDEHCVERLVPLEKRVVFSLVCAAKVKPDTVACNKSDVAPKSSLRDGAL